MDSPNGKLAADGRPHALIADDDAGVRALLREALEEEGWRVTAESEPPTLERVRALDPDLIVLDLRFRRGANGLAFLAALRRDGALSDLPVVVCSAAVDLLRRDAEALAALGATVVAKPFDLDQLIAALRASLDGRRDRSFVWPAADTANHREGCTSRRFPFV